MLELHSSDDHFLKNENHIFDDIMPLILDGKTPHPASAQELQKSNRDAKTMAFF